VGEARGSVSALPATLAELTLKVELSGKLAKRLKLPRLKLRVKPTKKAGKKPAKAGKAVRIVVTGR
jgi:hypothetical protein